MGMVLFLYMSILVTKKSKLSETEYIYSCFWSLIFRVGDLFYSSGPDELINLSQGVIGYEFEIGKGFGRVS